MPPQGNNMPQTITVLFVDDDEMNCKVFKRYFSRLDNIEVVTALSAHEAMENLERHKDAFSIVITDQRMPSIKGHQLLDHVRENSPETLRALTSANQEEIELLFKRTDSAVLIQHFFNKPWDFELITDIIYSSQLNKLIY